MLRHDGGIGDDIRPSISLVIFGKIPSLLTRTFSSSLECFFRSYGEELPQIPDIRIIHLPTPPLPELDNRERIFMRKLASIQGNIIIGVTRAGLWDPAPPRFIFGTSLASGVGILSTCRFERDSGSKEAAVRQLEKEVIKILGLACNIGHCRDSACIMEYHNKVWDLDRNVDVCGTCRDRMGRKLREFFDMGGSGNTALVDFV